MEKESTNRESGWVSALKRGDARAFDELFRLYGKRLYHFSLGYLKSNHDAEEIVQDVFMKIWHNRESLNPDLSFKAYLFKIAYRQIAVSFQKLYREQVYRHEIVESAIPFNQEQDDRLNYQSLLGMVDQLIEKLPPRQKEVLFLRKMEGLHIDEIAQKLNIAPKTVEHHLTEAIKNIKSGLSGEGLAGLLFFALFRDK